MRCLAGILLIAACLRAQTPEKKLIARLAEEADAFRRIAPQLIAQEQLKQRSLKPPPRFRPRMGEAATKPPQATWQRRELRSEYTLAAFAGEGGALHELRQVLDMDGKRVQDSKRAQETLARAITAPDDQRKKQILKDFEKHGLYGAVTDFGQLILLFTPRSIEQYEFRQDRIEKAAGVDLIVFTYQQIDGPEALTLIDGRKNDRTSMLKVRGEVWVTAREFRPTRITMRADQGSGGDLVQENAQVDYAPSAYGVVLPVATLHREVRAGQMVAENEFSYQNFQRFAASSDIKFQTEAVH